MSSGTSLRMAWLTSSGMKDGELHKFDVKASKTARVSAEQLATNVKTLWVLPDGTCGIVWNPRVTAEVEPMMGLH
jgi:hypothetical protein